MKQFLLSRSLQSSRDNRKITGTSRGVLAGKEKVQDSVMGRQRNISGKVMPEHGLKDEQMSSGGGGHSRQDAGNRLCKDLDRYVRRRGFQGIGSH